MIVSFFIRVSALSKLGWGCSGIPFFDFSCLIIKGVFSMIDFLDLFFDVFLFPIDPVNLDFENNVIMIILSLCLIGIGFSRLLRRVLL